MTTAVGEIVRFIEDELDRNLNKLEKNIGHEDIGTFYVGQVTLACQILNFIKGPNKKETKP